MRQIILKFKGKMSVKCDPSQGLELYQLILRQILTIVPYIIILDRISTLKLKNLAHFSLNYLGKGHSGSKTGNPEKFATWDIFAGNLDFVNVWALQEGEELSIKWLDFLPTSAISLIFKEHPNQCSFSCWEQMKRNMGTTSIWLMIWETVL